MILKKYALYFAWLVSLLALIGSFYWSERLHLEPCTLCWMQRAFLVPLVVMLGIATYREDRAVFRYAFPLAVLGTLTALYHVLVQKLPASIFPKFCSGRVSCTEEVVLYFGYITAPMLSAATFLLISLLLLSSRRSK